MLIPGLLRPAAFTAEKLRRLNSVESSWLGVLVPWINQDQELAAAEKELREELGRRLNNKLNSVPQRCRLAAAGIPTLREFSDILPQMTRIMLKDSARKHRRIHLRGQASSALGSGKQNRRTPEKVMDDIDQGRIVTFYSYKGGTGRTMALANLAWILASNGKRVLAVDWDLESPGLHKFFHPFLDRDVMSSTYGIMEIINDYESEDTYADSRAADWHRQYARVEPHAVSLSGHEFPDGGTSGLHIRWPAKSRLFGSRELPGLGRFLRQAGRGASSSAPCVRI